MLSNSVLLLAVELGWTIAFIFLGLGVGAVAGFYIYKIWAMKKIGSVKAYAAKQLEDSRQEAKTLRKEALLEAKEEQLRLRAEFDKEMKERRSEIQRMESRLAQREDILNKKESAIDKKQDTMDALKSNLEKKEEELVIRQVEIDKSQEKMIIELEKIAGMTSEEAKTVLMQNLLDSVKKDAALKAKEIEQEAKDEAEKKAKEIIGNAIQRCAADHASEITVSAVELPNDEMKGRIIGRVGRNIRAFENATGVDLIIDDTPDVVTLSGFDPIRREIARITLEKLISDGRIHPARIEEIVDKVRKEISHQIIEAGENAIYEAGLFGIHNELVKILGRLKYRTSYGQNVLKHSLEVAHLAGLMATELSADVKVAKRAGLLHDLGKAVDHEVEGTHTQIGVDLARKYKESEEVIHAIAAHHGDIEAKTIEAVLVQAADAISSARPGARRESLENYIKRLEKLESLANSFQGVDHSYAIQAGREIRVIVKPEEVNDDATIFMAKEIANKLESELEYPGQIKVNVIRELRSVEYAK
ncbi:MAG: ribonuclease Y [Christensenellales bacterium]|jgi:ribonuclease Y